MQGLCFYFIFYTDYSSIGIVSMEDRKRLFQLIQTLKSDSSPSLPTSMRQQTSQQSLQQQSQQQQAIQQQQSQQQQAIQQQQSQQQQAIQQQQSQQQQAIQQQQSQQQQQSTLQKLPQKQHQPPPSRLLNAYGIPLAGAAKISSTTSLTPSSLPKIASSSLASVTTSDRSRACVRKRPLNQKELRKNEQDITTVSGRRTIILTEPKYLANNNTFAPRVKVDLTKYAEEHTFLFDEVFDSDADNEAVYPRLPSRWSSTSLPVERPLASPMAKLVLYLLIRNREWKDVYHAGSSARSLCQGFA